MSCESAPRVVGFILTRDCKHRYPPILNQSHNAALRFFLAHNGITHNCRYAL